MTIALDPSRTTVFAGDRLSGAARANAIDRWIYVFTAASLIAVVLAGFVPDSFAKVAAVRAGTHPPFPLALHVHAVLMGSFLLLLLAQTILVATGRRKWHKQLGIAGFVLAVAMVISGAILTPITYHLDWNAALAAPPGMKQQLQHAMGIEDNVQLLPMRGGFLFATFMAIALWARTRDQGLHKRMIFLAVISVLGAAVARIRWLPTTMPHSPLTIDIFTWLCLSPMLIWDFVRNRSIHRAYVICAAFYLPATAVFYSLWDTPWWHTTIRHIMGV